MTTRRTVIIVLSVAVVVILIALDQRRRDRQRNQPRPFVSASPSPQPSPTPLSPVSTPPSPKVTVQRRQRAVTTTIATTSPTPDPSIAYNAARLARGLTSRVYFGGEQGPSGVVAVGQMVIVHPDGSREQFACMKTAPCAGCKVLVTRLVADVTCGEDRERYK